MSLSTKRSVLFALLLLSLGVIAITASTVIGSSPLSLDSRSPGGTTLNAASVNTYTVYLPAIVRQYVAPAPPGEEQLRRQEWLTRYLVQHSDSTGQPRPDLLQTGIAEFKQMNIVSAISAAPVTAGHAPSGGLVGVQWTSIGPAPLRVDSAHNVMGAGPDSGEVVDIAIDPRGATDQVIYLATNDGGIWKSTDGGATWKARTDGMPSLSMGAVTLDPANPSIVYAGTGDPFDGAGRYCCFGSFSLKGIGLYKSLDAGETWSVLNPNGIFTGVGINRIVMPASNVLLVATTSGLYRSIDGGLSFGANSPLFNDGNPLLAANTLVSDLKLDTANATTIYAAVNGQGIFVSTDSGATFPAASNLFNNTGAPSAASYGFISMAQSTQPNNQTLYASVQAANNNYLNLFKSTTRGASWAQPYSGPTFGCQCGYDQTIGVDPKDPNRVYLGFVNMQRSTDGGVNFGTIGDTDIHDDHHAILFSPASHVGGSPAPITFYVGTDGGFARTTDGGSSWTNLNEGIGTTLLGWIDIGRGSTSNRAYTYGTSQDTGVEQRQPGYSGLDWHLNTGGDGGIVAVDPSNAQHAYASYNAQLVGTTNAGNSWSILSGNGLPKSGCCGLVGFMAVDPNNGSILYATNGLTLYQSTDAGSNFVTMKAFPSGPTVCCTSIFNVATVGINSNVLWVGMADGSVWSTANALSGSASTWTQHTVTGAPTQSGVTMPVNGIAIDPTNTNQAVVVYGSFTKRNPINRTKHVFYTGDNGSTWTDISGTDGGNPAENLPDLPLSAVVIDPGTSPHSIIVATDVGVMRSTNGGVTWHVFGLGLPAALVSSLAIDGSANPPLLRAGTYGRSAFELTAATGPLLAVNTDLAFGQVGLNQSATRLVQLFNVGSADLHISSFARLNGSTDFQIISGPATPVTIPPGEEIDYTVRFQPTSTGNLTATFQIDSDDPFTPTYHLAASGFSSGPRISVSGDLNFGVVPRGTTAARNVIVQNIGGAPLVISSVAFTGGSDPEFSVLGPSTPVTLTPGSNVTFVIQFAPPASASGGIKTGTLRINSNDPIAPSVTLPATATIGVPHLTFSSSSLQFGRIAVDDRTFPDDNDQLVRISNQSSCPSCDVTLLSLPISGPAAGDFSLASPPDLPTLVAAGNELDLVVRFNPTAHGTRLAFLTVNSDDPVKPSVVITLTGEGLIPGVLAAPSPLIFGPTVFDPVCSGVCGQTQNATITNIGQAELILDTLTFNGSSMFSGPSAIVPPARVQPFATFAEAVTFHPTGGPARIVTGTLHIADTMGPTPTDPPVAIDVPICGESVGRGIRVLVYDPQGNIVPIVDRLTLQSHSLTIPVNIQEQDLNLVTIDPPQSCQRIQFQYENQDLQSTDLAGQRGSYYILSLTVGSRHATVSFTLAVNEFKTIIATVQ